MRKIHKGFSYHYHFIIKDLAEEFEKQFTSLVENTEKCITSSVPIKKVTRIDKNRKEIIKIISYRSQFIDCTKFMGSSL